jgi:hypothetical protein
LENWSEKGNDNDRLLHIPRGGLEILTYRYGYTKNGYDRSTYNYHDIYT